MFVTLGGIRGCWVGWINGGWPPATGSTGAPATIGWTDPGFWTWVWFPETIIFYMQLKTLVINKNKVINYFTAYYYTVN